MRLYILLKKLWRLSIMSKKKRDLKKKKAKLVRAKEKVLKRREILRDERKTQEELDKIRYENRERLEPARNE